MRHSSLSLRIRWGRSLAQARASAGLTQINLAELVGTTQQRISAWESGVALPRDEMRPRLARALGVPTHRLFPYDNGEEAA